MDAENSERSDLERFLDPGFIDVDELLDAIHYEVSVSDGLFRKAGLELRECPPEKRKLAVTISGGGAAGAYSAGLLEVLLDRLRARGIKVGLLVGTSSGAVNGYGVFVEELGMGNPAFESDPVVRQPFASYIASVWSFLARDSKASRWMVGRRSWIVRLASRGLLSRRRKAAAGLALLLAVAVAIPGLLAPIALLARGLGLGSWGWIGSESLADALPDLVGLVAAMALLLGTAGWLAWRAFRNGLFRDAPLLHLLANTGPGGTLKRQPGVPRSLAVDRARVLSRDLVREWYARREEVPEFIAASTDVTAGRGCLFTLVRPETHAHLLRREWMAVQFDSESGDSQEYRSQSGALFTLPQNLIQALAASSAVPGAFPTQRIGIYGADARRPAHHHFVDGGVLNNSPVHIAIDAGATHVISLEILPFSEDGALEDDGVGDEGYGLLHAALTTFAIVLEQATQEDIRRTVSWNRFLTQRPGSLHPGRGAGQRQRRVVPIYRVAPSEPLAGTVEFDGRFAAGRPATTLRDMLRRGMLDMQGRNIWAATVRHAPGWNPPEDA